MNGYELSFIRWFRRDGWQIRGTEVWCQDPDDECPFKLTRPMVHRLELAGEIRRIWPTSAPDWLECFQ
jgi:hypothetical protein